MPREPKPKKQTPANDAPAPEPKLDAKQAGKLSDRIAARLQKRFGSDAATRLGEGRPSAKSEVTEVIPSGIEVVDHFLWKCGGFPVGRITEAYGEEQCIASDTFIAFQVRTRDGAVQSSKGGTVARLYERFHKLPPRSGGRVRKETENAVFYAPSMNAEGRIVQTRVTGVVLVGKKQCYTLTTRSGKRITATADHAFFTGEGYARLDTLLTGDVVYVHNNTPFRSTVAYAPRRAHRAYLYVKHHPVAGKKTATPNAGRSKDKGYAYTYHRLARSRAVVEARRNGLTLSAYVARLNNGALDGLVFLPRDHHVHHIDENVMNDSPENLAVLEAGEHLRDHADERHNNLRFVAVPDTIVRIEEAGERDVYDVQMEGPSHNFVAGGVVVHNCGKTTWMYQAIAAAQRDGALTVVIDAEQSFDEARCAEYGADTNSIVVASPDSMDQGFDMTRGVLEDHDASVPLLIVYDSLAAKGIAKANDRMATIGQSISGGKVGKIQPGEVAKVTSQELNKIPAALVEKRAHLLFMNQTRTNVGVMFGDPTTTPGGKAPKFFATHRVQIIKGKAIKDPVLGDHLGRWVTFLATKTRFVPPFRKVRVPLWYTARRDKSTGSEEFKGPGYDNEAGIIEHAKERGLIDGRIDRSEALAAAREAIAQRGWDGFDEAAAPRKTSDDEYTADETD